MDPRLVLEPDPGGTHVYVRAARPDETSAPGPGARLLAPGEWHDGVPHSAWREWAGQVVDVPALQARTRSGRPSALSAYERVSLAVAVASLVGMLLVWRQLEVSTEALESTALQSLHAQQAELTRTFLENPDLLPFFSDTSGGAGRDTLRARADALADLQIDFFDMYLTQRDFIGRLRADTAATAAWDRYMDDTFRQGTVMCDRLGDVERWYAAGFVERMRSACGVPAPDAPSGR